MLLEELVDRVTLISGKRATLQSGGCTADATGSIQSKSEGSRVVPDSAASSKPIQVPSSAPILGDKDIRIKIDESTPVLTPEYKCRSQM